MNRFDADLNRFSRRVRIVRSWKGLAIGACFGSAIAAVWAGLDWANLASAEWAGLGIVAGSGAVLGGLIGLLLRISPKALADSIDRRADLEDRLVTSIERTGSLEGFDEALHADARAHLEGLRPATLYPVRVGRWQAAAIVLAALASTLFLLGNTPVLLSDQQKKDRQEMKQAGQVVEHVLKPAEEHPEIPSQAAEDRKLEEALRRLAKELDKAKLTKEEALQKSNELQKQAQELVKNRANSAEQSLAKAESAFEKMEKAEIEKSGVKNTDPDQLKQDAEAQQKMDGLQKEMQDNQDQMRKLQSDLSKAGPKSELQAKLSKEMLDLLKKQSELNKEMEQLKLSKAVQDMLKRMTENPLYRELLKKMAELQKAEEMQKKLEEAMKDAKENGEQQKLSHEDIEKMQQELEDLAKQLKDDQAMTDYLQKMIDALKAGCST